MVRIQVLHILAVGVLFLWPLGLGSLDGLPCHIWDVLGQFPQSLNVTCSSDSASDKRLWLCQCNYMYLYCIIFIYRVES